MKIRKRVTAESASCSCSGRTSCRNTKTKLILYCFEEDVSHCVAIMGTLYCGLCSDHFVGLYLVQFFVNVLHIVISCGLNKNKS